jgi:hypothetical protein
MRVTDREVGEVIIHRCGSRLGEFACFCGELGKREGLREFLGGTGVNISNKTIIFILPTACH